MFACWSNAVHCDYNQTNCQIAPSRLPYLLLVTCITRLQQQLLLGLTTTTVVGLLLLRLGDLPVPLLQYTVWYCTAIWHLLATSVHKRDMVYDIEPNVKYAQIEFVLHLDRKPLYYAVNIILPCSLLVVISLLVSHSAYYAAVLIVALQALPLCLSVCPSFNSKTLKRRKTEICRGYSGCQFLVSFDQRPKGRPHNISPKAIFFSFSQCAVIIQAPQQSIRISQLASLQVINWIQWNCTEIRRVAPKPIVVVVTIIVIVINFISWWCSQKTDNLIFKLRL